MKMYCLFLILMLVGCDTNSLYENDFSIEKEDIIISIYPGSTNDIYYFIIKKDELICIRGEGTGKSISSDNYIKKVKERKNIKLVNDEYNLLVKLAGELTNDLKEDIYILDSWDIEVYFNENIIKSDYYNMNDNMEKFINEIIKISPIVIDIYNLV